MLPSFFKKQIANFLVLVLALSFFVNVDDSYAVYKGVRSPIGWNASSGCSTGPFEFDISGGNKDADWVLDNPTCLSFIALQGAMLMTTGYFVDYMCIGQNMIAAANAPFEKAGNPIPPTPFFTPNMFYKFGYGSMLCAKRVTENASLDGALVAACFGPQAALFPPGCAAAAVQAGLATKDMSQCCGAYASYVAAFAVGLAALAIIYASAKSTYEKARICGHDWNIWAKVDINGDLNPSGFWRNGKYPGSYQSCIESIFIDNINSCSLPDVDGISALKVDLRNKYYREYLYGGKEFSDEGKNACENPSSWGADKRISIFGYTNNNMRYYMRGSAKASNYACHRFALIDKSDPAVKEAYECCKRRSQNSICIENARADVPGLSLAGFSDYGSKFCEFGERCNVKDVWFETYSSRVKPNYICAKTYSVCPYDHQLGGGTEITVFKKDENGHETSDAENFCQVMKHCSKIPTLPYIRISDLDGAFISSACRDLKGDTQNVYGFDMGIIPIAGRGFSAPIVQCFKETMENIMMNRAGDTKCVNPDESPSNGVCKSGYFYKKDSSLRGDSFFIKIQDKLRAIIKMVLTLSIAFFGAMILLGGQEIKRKDLLSYILKIGLVMYFALGDGWQFGFVDGVINSSDYLASIVMRLDDTGVEDKKDGCQFPRFNYADENSATRYDDPKYPPRREYLKIWDTLDCKLSRAIGFGPEVSVPNLVKMFLAGFFTGGLGIVFLIAAFIFAFFLLAIIMRAMHIFLMATIAIIIMMYVSPIVITLALFKRTKAVFDGWWKQLLGLVLQPVILFAYLGAYIAIFDKIIIGEATFNGDGKSVPKTIDCNDPAAKDSSIYCIFRIADLKTYSGFEAIGIGIPLLTSMNSERLNTIIKSAFIMFIFSEFMNKIGALAKELVGGQLESKTASAFAIAGQAYEGARGIQKRGTRAIKKIAIRGGGGAAGFVKGKFQSFGNKGKRVHPGGAPIGGSDAADTSRKGVSLADSGGGRGASDAAKGGDSGAAAVANSNESPSDPAAPTPPAHVGEADPGDSGT